MKISGVVKGQRRHSGSVFLFFSCRHNETPCCYFWHLQIKNQDFQNHCLSTKVNSKFLINGFGKNSTSPEGTLESPVQKLKPQTKPAYNEGSLHHCLVG